jgi:uncharacterized membrane protein
MVEGKPLGFHAKARAVTRSHIDFCSIQQRFCGDAAFVEAHAAQRFLLKQHGFEAAFRGQLCGPVSSWAAAYDGKVVPFHDFLPNPNTEELSRVPIRNPAWLSYYNIASGMPARGISVKTVFLRDAKKGVQCTYMYIYKEVLAMKTRQEIKDLAKAKFQAQNGISIGVLVLCWLLMGAAAGTFVGGFFLAPALMVGFYFFFLKVYRGSTVDIQDIFQGFKEYGKSIGGMLWMYLFIFLWALLFWIPGIVKAMSYFMTPYILAECPKVNAKDALKLSMRMTQGYKGKIFVLYLSFIGWMFLSAITCGIVFILYAGPYMYTSYAGMYEELKKNALEKGVITAEELA